MTNQSQAPVATDAELRALWQQHGGTFFDAVKRESAQMPATALTAFLRAVLRGESMVKPEAVLREPSPAEIAQWRADFAHAQAKSSPVVLQAAPAAAPTDGMYASTLMKLIAAVCPGLDTGNLLEDARKAIEAVPAGAKLAGYFGIDDEPATDGNARYLMVSSQHAGDDDVFPLYRRPATITEMKDVLQAHANEHRLKIEPAASAPTPAPAPAARKRAAAKKVGAA